MTSTWAYGTGLVVGMLVLGIVQIPSHHARLIACDVGQGDAFLITKGSNQVLIDGGPSSDKLLSCLERYMPFWDRQIELIVLTNTDADHLTGLISAVERYRLIRFVTADGVHASDTLTRFVDTLASRSVPVLGLSQGEILHVGRRDLLSFRVLWPPDTNEQYLAVYSNQISHSEREQILGVSAKRGDLNERSVILEWDENGYKVLFMGDSGFQTEKSLAVGGWLDDIDLLKVGHHGSKYSTSADFLRAIRPERAIISVGDKNRYGHPTDETLQRLGYAHVRVSRTDRNGTVVYTIPPKSDTP